MKTTLFTLMLIASATIGKSMVIEFDLSPLGLHPLNEVIPGTSSGSGNEIGRGISFDTASLTLTLNLGYGSGAGFTDLTGAAFAWFLHGPAPIGETAPVIFDLAPLHTFAADSAQGGYVVGSLLLNPDQVVGLLSGLDYISIYTTANMGGELRGNLVAAGSPVPESGPGNLLLGGAMMAVFWSTTRVRRAHAHV